LRFALAYRATEDRLETGDSGERIINRLSYVFLMENFVFHCVYRGLAPGILRHLTVFRLYLL